MPRDLIANTTTRSIVQDLADRLGLVVREFNRLDATPDKEGEPEEQREGRRELRDLCWAQIMATEISILTQFPKNATDAVMMLTVAHGNLDDGCEDATLAEISRLAVDRATAFLMEHFGVFGTDFSEFIFADYTRDRALGRDVEVPAERLIAA